VVTIGALLASSDSGDLAEGTPPKSSLELRMLRRGTTVSRVAR
jgi:hypothetical protein